MSRNLLKIAIIAMIVGLSLAVVGFIGINGDIKTITDLYNDNDSYVDKEFTTTYSDTKDLVIDIMNRDISVEPSTDNELKVVYFDSEDDFLIITEDSQSINIDNDVKNTIFSFPTWVSANRRLVKIYLPLNFEGDIHMHTTNGNISITDIIDLNDLNISSTNGNLELVNMDYINNLEFSTTNGNSVLNNATIDDITLSSTNGNVDLINIISTQIDIETTNGSIETQLIGNPDNYKMITRTVNGRITFNGFVLGNGTHQENGIHTLSFKTTNGRIKIIIQP